MNRVNVRKNKVNFIYVGVAIVLLITIIFYQSFVSIAKTDIQLQPKYKYFQSVEIEKGDTIWSIASQYISSEYNSLDEYVNEIIQLNNLETIEIHVGEYIVVPYWSL